MNARARLVKRLWLLPALAVLVLITRAGPSCGELALMGRAGGDTT